MVTNTDLAAQLDLTIDGWQTFVNEIKDWSTSVANTSTFTDPLGGPDIVVETLYKITTDYQALTGAEWATTAEDVLVPSGNLIDEYSCYHYFKKVQALAASVASIGDEVAIVQAAVIAAQLSESNASSSETAADADAIAAAASAASATASESNASASAVSAVAARDKAQDWAEELEDVPVETGEFSAHHWAIKAAATAATVTDAAADAAAAAASAAAALASETAAAASEGTASAASATSVAAKDLAVTAQAAAELAETNAELAETNAETAETNALASSVLASDWAEKAEDLPVTTGKFSALHHAAKAAIDAAAASVSESNADADAITAAADAAAALVSKNAAAASETAAGLSETAAGLSETAAALAKTNAETAETNAVAAKNLAVTAQGNAETAETNAAASAVLSSDWAEELEDVEVTTGKYSALHHAAKAAASAAAATNTFDTLTDVDITGRADQQVAYYDLAADKIKFKAGGGGAVDSVAGKTGVVTLVEADITDLGTYETADATILKDADIGVSIEAFAAKNTGWNKVLGTGAGQVAEGNHAHPGVYEPVDATLVRATLTAIVAGELLVWSGTAWINQTLAEAGVAAAGHNHAGVYEPADATILKDADIGVTVQAAGSYEPADGTILKDADIGSTVAAEGHNHSGTYEPVDATLVRATITTIAAGELLSWSGTAWINQTLAEAGVAASGHTHSGVYEPADATILKDADIGVTVQAFDSTIVVDADIGVSVAAQGHNHSGTYEPVDATILRQADVDDTPVDGVTTAPVSSNWAFDHAASATAHGLPANIVGKQTEYIPASSIIPAVTSGAPFSQVETTAGRPDSISLDFDASADEYGQFAIAFPKQWNKGTVTFQAIWSSSGAVTTGVAWALQAVACSDNDTFNAVYGTPVVVTDAAQSAANENYVTAESGAVTIAGTPADGDTVLFQIFRDVSNGSDNMTQDARLHGLNIFWTNNALTDN